MNKIFIITLCLLFSLNANSQTSVNWGGSDSVIAGSFYSTNTGLISNNRTDWRRLSEIDIVGGSVLHITEQGNRNDAIFMDANGDFISKTVTSSVSGESYRTVTAPDNASSVRINLSNEGATYDALNDSPSVVVFSVGSGTNSIVPDGTTNIVLDTLKAFPSAYGAGAGISGARGKPKIYVTTLNASGPGSERQAILDAKTAGGAYILYAVGGHADHDGHLYITDVNNVYFAAQTANDLGGHHSKSVSLGDNPNVRSTWEIAECDNIIIRYKHFSGQGEFFENGGNRISPFKLTDCSRSMVDHVSGGHGSYSVAAAFGHKNPNTNKYGDVTVQYGLHYENTRGHNTTSILGKQENRFPSNAEFETAVDGWDIHHSLDVFHSHRQATNYVLGTLQTGIMQNNYIYGWTSRLGTLRGDGSLDHINNVYQQGNEYPTVNDLRLQKFTALSEDEVIGRPLGTMSPEIYAVGNEAQNNDGSVVFPTTRNQWEMFSMRDNYAGYPAEDEYLPVAWQRSTPIQRVHPIPITPTDQVKQHNLTYAGASVRFNADCTTYRDPAHKLENYYIDAVINNTIPNFTSSAYGDGGLGDLLRTASLVPNATNNPSVTRDLTTWDADLDGLPDAWEALHGVTDPDATKVDWTFNAGTANEYTVTNIAGYHNIEIFLEEQAGGFCILKEAS